jgi:hypothetical protein
VEDDVNQKLWPHAEFGINKIMMSNGYEKHNKQEKPQN